MSQGFSITLSCGVDHRSGLNLALLWLGLACVALIQPLAWEVPNAMGMALKNKKKKPKTFVFLYSSNEKIKKEN